MKTGDKVIYIFDPYEGRGGTINSIMFAQVKKTPKESFMGTEFTIHPIRMIYGQSGMHDQMAAEDYLHEIGDREVIKMIFERKLERE